MCTSLISGPQEPSTLNRRSRRNSGSACGAIFVLRRACTFAVLGPGRRSLIMVEHFPDLVFEFEIIRLKARRSARIAPYFITGAHPLFGLPVRSETVPHITDLLHNSPCCLKIRERPQSMDGRLRGLQLASPLTTAFFRTLAYGRGEPFRHCGLWSAGSDVQGKASAAPSISSATARPTC